MNVRRLVSVAAVLLAACGGGAGAARDAGPTVPPDARLRDEPDAAAPPDAGGAPADAPAEDAADEGGPAPDPLTVHTPGGALHGALSGDIRVFRGVPYAEPPVRPLRFAPPVAKAAWAGVRDATRVTPPCPQYGDPISDELAPMSAYSEDCLTLDVYAPASPGSPRPVMVFLHGGGFTTGGAPSYDARALSAAGDVVVVVVQYRLGPLGFLAHPTLDAALGGRSGNMGLRDQQLALRWVQTSAAAFGGDPAQVTLFGESAGAVATCLHMVMPASAGLAQRFIIESGACVAGEVQPWTRARIEQLSGQLIAALCPGAVDPVVCLRGLTPEQLVRWLPNDPVRETVLSLVEVSATVGQDFWPHVDGDLLPDHPLVLIGRGAFAKGPLIVGSNADEWRTQEHFGFPRPDSRLVFDFWTSLMVQGYDVDRLRAHYAPTSDAEAPAAFRRLWSDMWFRCPSRVLARAATAQGVPVFLYDFAVPPGGHAQELDYVFGLSEGFLSRLFPGTAPIPLTRSVVSATQAFWTSFAHHGAPEAPGGAPWPAYTRAADAHLTLAEPVGVARGLSAADCDLWDELWGTAR